MKYKNELAAYINDSLEPFDKDEINKTLILSFLRDFEQYQVTHLEKFAKKGDSQ